LRTLVPQRPGAGRYERCAAFERQQPRLNSDLLAGVVGHNRASHLSTASLHG